MRHRHIIMQAVLLLATAVGLASCAADITGAADGRRPIRLVAMGEDDGGSESTRAASNLQNKAFDGGETIKAYIEASNGEKIGDPTTYTAEPPVNNVNELVPDVEPFYPSGEVTVDVLALYPPSVTNQPSTFTVQADQQADDDYRQSDLKYASVSTHPKTDAPIGLHFTHKMAKMTITVRGEDDVKLKQVKLIKLNRTTQFTPSTGELGTLSNPGDIIVAEADDEAGVATLSGSVMFPPQLVNTEMIEVDTDAGTATFAVVSKSFVAGKEYVANLVIGQHNLNTVATITDWNSDKGVVAIVPSTGQGLVVADIPAVTYELDAATQKGKAWTPKPEVTFSNSEVELKENDHYVYMYYNNTDAGTGTVIVIGQKEPIKNLASIKTFLIRQATGSLSYPAATKSVEYTKGEKVDHKLTIVGDGSMAYTSSNETVASINPVTGEVTIGAVGTATITATMASDKNYTGATASYKLTVNQRAVSKLTVNLTDYPAGGYTYDGTSKEPTVEVLDGKRTLTKDVDYTLTYANNTNAGMASVTVLGVGDYVGSVKKDYTINKATPVITLRNGNLQMAVSTTENCAATTTIGSLTYSSSKPAVATVSTSGIVYAVASGTATITVSVAAGANWNAATSKTFNVTVLTSDQEFGYTGKVQTFKCEMDGIYKLEVWGAQGGSYAQGRYKYDGGNGAYVSGTVKLKKDDVLHVFVGGAGAMGGVGGWNGGGTGTSDSQGGGGATDISLDGSDAGGTIWEESRHLNTRIIVAAGGGGALFYWQSFFNFGAGQGGHGGAWDGQKGQAGSDKGNGGTRTSGGSGGQNSTSGSFGKGGNYSGSGNAGAGGGGWYGGGSGGSKSKHGAGGGGASFIFNAETDKSSYYPSGVSRPSSDYYVTLLTKSQGAQTGNGKAKISFVSAE